MMKASINAVTRRISEMTARKEKLTGELQQSEREAAHANSAVTYRKNELKEIIEELLDLNHGLTLLKNSEGIVDYSKEAAE